MVNVKVFRHTGMPESRVLETGATVGDLRDELDGFDGKVLINGVAASNDHELGDNDTVVLSGKVKGGN